MTKRDDELLTLAQAAQELGRHQDTLRQGIHRGTVQATKLGPVWVITRAELERQRARRTPVDTTAP